MKKLFLLTVLSFFVFTIKAQKLSFEETIKYINNKIICCSSPKSKIKKIEVSKNGAIKIEKEGDLVKFNLFDLYKGKDGAYSFSEESKLYGFGFDSYNSAVMFRFSADINQYIIMTNDEDAKRVASAFRHLLTLCTKEKEPFDN